MSSNGKTYFRLSLIIAIIIMILVFVLSLVIKFESNDEIYRLRYLGVFIATEGVIGLGVLLKELLDEKMSKRLLMKFIIWGGVLISGIVLISFINSIQLAQLCGLLGILSLLFLMNFKNNKI